MPSHDIRIVIEHYENGGFGVSSYNYCEMGLSTMAEVKEAVSRLMNKELNILKKE